MGIVRFGVPEQEVMHIAKLMNLSIFFEGGTYKGQTALRVSRMFKKVITVERSETMFKMAQANIGYVENIQMLKGDTRDYIKIVLENNNNVLFWLDAHWSGAATYGDNDECPLLEELSLIFKYKKDYAILIDDARLFMSPPPKPHKLESWPTLKAIIMILPHDWELVIYEDVIYLLPEKISLVCREYFQQKASNKWLAAESDGSLFARVGKAIGIMRC